MIIVRLHHKAHFQQDYSKLNGKARGLSGCRQKHIFALQTIPETTSYLPKVSINLLVSQKATF